MSRVRKCKVRGCQGLHVARGYCARHYQQVMRHGHLLPKDREYMTPPPECIVDGCHEKPLAKGLCQRHYGQVRRTGRVRYEGSAPARVCTVCGAAHHARGYCVRHYPRWQHWRKIYRELVAEQRPDLDVEVTVTLTRDEVVVLLAAKGCDAGIIRQERNEPTDCRRDLCKRYDDLRERIADALEHVPEGGSHGDDTAERGDDGADRVGPGDNPALIRRQCAAVRDQHLTAVQDYLSSVRAARSEPGGSGA